MKCSIPVSKINILVDIDTDTTPVTSVDAMVFYGLKQWFNDAHAGCTVEKFPDEVKRLAEARKRVDERVNAIRTGVGLPGMGSILTPEVVAAVENQRRLAALDPETRAQVEALLSGKKPAEMTPAVEAATLVERARKRA